MTTIAYKDGVMAGDSQSSWHYKELNAKKVQKRGDMLIGFAGDFGSGVRFCNWMFNKGEQPNVIDDSFSAIVVKGSKCYHYDRTLVPFHSDKYIAIGSGAEFAIAAMDCGKSAVDAVKIASRRDPHTGGKIRTVKQ